MSPRIAQSFAASFLALTDDAVAFDRSRSGARLRVSGPDRIEWLQGLLTNDIAALGAGEGCYAAYLTPQGRMIGDMRVLVRTDDVLLDVEAPARESLLSRLDQYIIMEDVTLTDASDELGCVGVAGPASARRLAAQLGMVGETLSSLAEYHHHPVSVDGHDGLIVATRDLGVDGYEVYLPPPAASSLLGRLRALGFGDLHPQVADAARIEAGRPRFGVDMDEDTIPLEAGIEPRAISFSKGCYVGQEIIIRVVHRGKGRVARRICRLVSEGGADVHGGDEPTVPWPRGSEVRRDGKVVGRITSAAFSAGRGRFVALAMLGRDAMTDGTDVEVDAPEPWTRAKVEALSGVQAGA
jgi:folate-binding protein YgfZ